MNRRYGGRYISTCRTKIVTDAYDRSHPWGVNRNRAADGSTTPKRAGLWPLGSRFDKISLICI